MAHKRASPFAHRAVLTFRDPRKAGDAPTSGRKLDRARKFGVLCDNFLVCPLQNTIDISTELNRLIA
jgi:hypothetical protein